jgi:Asp-tRNA(Asn)/Glu-tRNA(Gln) amidotransferase A subunit family amidase
MHGLPIGLQVVGRKLQEEKTLAGMKIIEEIVKCTDRFTLAAEPPLGQILAC